MKVLYVAYRHDPRNPDAASGSDYNFYTSIKRNGIQVEVLGPFLSQAVLPERGFRRLYISTTGKRYAKFPLSVAWHVSKCLNEIVSVQKPDVIFTLFPPSLVFYTGQAPCVYRLDTCFLGWQRQYPQFGRLAFRLSLWEERRAFQKCARIITHSEWTKNILVSEYRAEAERIEVFPNLSALPSGIVPTGIEAGVDKRLASPIRLLLVGRDYHRKGVDIAIEIVRRLNVEGMAAELIVCGTGGGVIADLLNLLGLTTRVILLSCTSMLPYIGRLIFYCTQLVSTLHQ